MPETVNQNLSGVPETSLAALYIRAMESQRPDALIKDAKAEELVRRMSYDFQRIRKIHLLEANKVVRLLVTREMDRKVRDYLARHPDAVVVHIGCGLDSRFERVDNGQVEWYDLDLPEMIALRRELIGGDSEHYHLLASSVLHYAWMDEVSVHRPRPFLFVAEVVFVYLEAAHVKSLLLELCDRFPGAELIFDAWSPVHVRVSNLQISPTFHGLLRWGIWHGEEIERWGKGTTVSRRPSGRGIHLLDEWGFMDRPEPRLARYPWLRPIDALFRTMRVYHFQLGDAGETTCQD